MNPFLLFLLAIVSPILLVLCLFLPPYLGVALACFIIYYKSGADHPLAGEWFDVFYILDVYRQLFAVWFEDVMAASFLTYSLPLILPALLGIVLGLWLTARLSRKLSDVFEVGVG